MSAWLDQAAPRSQGPRPRVRRCPRSNGPSPAGPRATESDSRRSACQTAVGIASLSAFSAPNTSANHTAVHTILTTCRHLPEREGPDGSAHRYHAEKDAVLFVSCYLNSLSITFNLLAVIVLSSVVY